LRVAAATSVGEAGYARSEALVDAGVDLVVVDTAHGHSTARARHRHPHQRMSNSVAVVAGNIATAEGARALIDAGADSIKVGIGPGSICTTRIVAGVGVPQLTAIMDAWKPREKPIRPVIADGGIKYSGDLAKALAAAAIAPWSDRCSPAPRNPRRSVSLSGRSYKTYRGMGSVSAMARGSADRYFQQEIKDTLKLVPEGVEGQVAIRARSPMWCIKLVGGCAPPWLCGAKDLADFHAKASSCECSGAGLRESHVHDVTITRESPNYPSRLKSSHGRRSTRSFVKIRSATNTHRRARLRRVSLR